MMASILLHSMLHAFISVTLATSGANQVPFAGTDLTDFIHVLSTDEGWLTSATALLNNETGSSDDSLRILKSHFCGIRRHSAIAKVRKNGATKDSRECAALIKLVMNCLGQ